MDHWYDLVLPGNVFQLESCRMYSEYTCKKVQVSISWGRFSDSSTFEVVMIMIIKMYLILWLVHMIPLRNFHLVTILCNEDTLKITSSILSILSIYCIGVSNSKYNWRWCLDLFLSFQKFLEYRYQGFGYLDTYRANAFRYKLLQTKGFTTPKVRFFCDNGFHRCDLLLLLSPTPESGWVNSECNFVKKYGKYFWGRFFDSSRLIWYDNKCNLIS
jgi:hypothetical protein